MPGFNLKHLAVLTHHGVVIPLVMVKDRKVLIGGDRNRVKIDGFQGVLQRLFESQLFEQHIGVPLMR